MELMAPRYRHYFEAFFEEISSDSSVDEQVADRLRQTVTSGEKIDSDALHRALFADDGIA